MFNVTSGSCTGSYSSHAFIMSVKELGFLCNGKYEKFLFIVLLPYSPFHLPCNKASPRKLGETQVLLSDYKAKNHLTGMKTLNPL